MLFDDDLLERIKNKDPTLKMLDLDNQQLNDNDVRQLVNALVTNTTLTTLAVGYNQLGDEGAKALAANTILTVLDVACNQIGTEAEEQLKQAIARNNQQIISRRNQFIRTLIILAYDKGNPDSQSLWSRLPQELMVCIISLIDFRSGSIGKNTQQIKHCAAFMFSHVADSKDWSEKQSTPSKALK